MSSGYDIDQNSFEKYALDTARLYVHLYDWHPMSTSVHKILIHGASVMKFFSLPIGQLSEDVQESRHKEIRYYREHHSRKTSRTSTNHDI